MKNTTFDKFFRCRAYLGFMCSIKRKIQAIRKKQLDKCKFKKKTVRGYILRMNNEKDDTRFLKMDFNKEKPG